MLDKPGLCWSWPERLLVACVGHPVTGTRVADAQPEAIVIQSGFNAKAQVGQSFWPEDRRASHRLHRFHRSRSLPTGHQAGFNKPSPSAATRHLDNTLAIRHLRARLSLSWRTPGQSKGVGRPSAKANLGWLANWQSEQSRTGERHSLRKFSARFARKD